MVLGEIMAEKDENDESQLFCMGYSGFIEKFEGSTTFREWFFSLGTWHGKNQASATQRNSSSRLETTSFTSFNTRSDGHIKTRIPTWTRMASRSLR
jgi:hypothetical protein